MPVIVEFDEESQEVIVDGGDTVLEFDDVDKGSPGWDLGDLNDVLITSVQNEDVLKYNSGSGKWINGSLASVVVGPSSATDNAVARFDGTTGKLIQNSVVTIGDTGIIAGATWQGGIIAVAYGGTGAATASANRVFAGPATGADAAPSFRALVANDIPDLSATYQPKNANLTSISGLGTAADKMIYTTAASTWAESTITAAGRAILDDADASAQRTTLDVAQKVTSSTDLAFVRFNGAAGAHQNSQTKEDSSGNVTVVGNLTVQGQSFQADHLIQTGSTFVLINNGETGVGVTNVRAGLEIDRGSLNPYRFQMHETTDDLRIGQYYVTLPYTGLSGVFQQFEKITGATSGAIGWMITDGDGAMALRGTATAFQNGETIRGATSNATATAGTQIIVDSTQACATRQDVPSSGGIAYWNASDYRMDTAANLTFNSTTKVLSLYQNQSISTLTGTVLQIVGSNNTKTRIEAVAFGSSAYAVFTGRSARNNPNSPGNSQTNDTIVAISACGYGDGWPTTNKAEYRIHAGENWSSTQMATYHSWTTTATGGLTTTEKLRLWPDGGLQIDGTFSASPGAGSLSMSGSAKIGTLTGTATSIIGGTSTGVLTTVTIGSNLAINSGTLNATMDLTNAVILAPGSSTRNIIQASGAYIPFIVKQYDAQTDNLTEWRNSSNTVLSFIGSDGRLGLGTSATGTQIKLAVNAAVTIDNYAVARINTGADANKGLVIQRNSATQSANLFEIQSSTGALKFAFTPDGEVFTDWHATASSTNVLLGVDAAGAGNMSHSTGTQGWHNTYVGNLAGNATTTAGQNTFIGSSAGAATTVGASSTFIGYLAGAAFTDGGPGTCVGAEAGRYHRSGNMTAFGYQAGRMNATYTGTSPAYNTAIGHQSLLNLYSTGNHNTALGYQSGTAVTTGSDNTLLGYLAGNNITTGSTNILIGASIAASSASVSNELNIGGLIKGNMTGVITTAQIYAPDGAVGTPAYSFQSDTNTGIYWVSADKIGFTTGGTLRVTITDTGSVTIGAYTLPSTDGSANQFLKTNGSGSVSWASAITNSETGSNSIGILSTDSAAARVVAIGKSSSSAIDGVSIGYSASSTANGTAIGSMSYATDYSVAIGEGSSAGGANSVVVGEASTCNNNTHCIIVGRNLSVSAVDSLNIGNLLKGNMSGTAANDYLAVIGDALYLGDTATNGTWRFLKSGSDLLIQKRESGSYVTKTTITA